MSVRFWQLNGGKEQAGEVRLIWLMLAETSVPFGPVVSEGRRVSGTLFLTFW